MDTDALTSLIGKLDGDLDHLKGALTPLLKEALIDTARKLPLLDKAHLYILVTHVIELLLYYYLQLNGVEVQDHPIFRELTRVKQYMKKIYDAGIGPTKNTSNLDKPAAQRFISHALAGNDKNDTKRAQQQQHKNAVPRNGIGGKGKDEIHPGRRRKRVIENDQRKDKDASSRKERKRLKADRS